MADVTYTVDVVLKTVAASMDNALQKLQSKTDSIGKTASNSHSIKWIDLAKLLSAVSGLLLYSFSNNKSNSLSERGRSSFLTLQPFLNLLFSQYLVILELLSLNQLNDCQQRIVIQSHRLQIIPVLV